jgi:hypothetical protein
MAGKPAEADCKCEECLREGRARAEDRQRGHQRLPADECQIQASVTTGWQALPEDLRREQPGYCSLCKGTLILDIPT